ncbi:BA14K family protein [Bradyrhizobium sp.]|uniref:BA14K family protein n=1 Tax=Bradyrhizobium sp. TaxID=376 RepID=UPI003C588BBD
MVVAALAATSAFAPALAQDLGVRPLRYGNTSPWSYDGRDDPRDFPTNGFFPGNYAADPGSAWLGVEGLFAGNSYRSPQAYPSQVVIGATPAPAACQRYRSYDPASGTFVGRDGARHRC